MKNYKFIILLSFACSFFSSAGAVKYIPITTKNTCLLLKVNEKNRLEQTFFGASIKNIGEMESTDLETFSSYSTF
ncbi:MAG: hypothetical protein LBV74_20500, partial [Tannerella sp.]|nr:hypothetical protein [Tannerella sp.]